MRIIRFEDREGVVQWGEALDGERARLIHSDILEEIQVTQEIAEVQRVLAPLVPVNIIAIGLNYREHARETGKQVPDAPLIFCKLTSSVTDPESPIVLPEDAPGEVDFEGELAVVIGRRCREVDEEHALEYVLGYTCANDVSARDCQVRRDLQWTRAKSFDTFCPLGPALLVDPAIDPNNLNLRTRLNGDVMQESNTSDMIFSVPSLISYLSHQFTLQPGTVILTGTPHGVGVGRDPQVFLKDGDVIEVEIEGIGTLHNPVRRSD